MGGLSGTVGCPVAADSRVSSSNWSMFIPEIACDRVGGVAMSGTVGNNVNVSDEHKVVCRYNRTGKDHERGHEMVCVRRCVRRCTEGMGSRGVARDRVRLRGIAWDRESLTLNSVPDASDASESIVSAEAFRMGPAWSKYLSQMRGVRSEVGHGVGVGRWFCRHG